MGHPILYYAIIFPLSNQNKWLTTKSQYILIIGWLLGIGWAAIPNTIIEPFVWNNQTYLDCRPDSDLYDSRWYNIVSVMLTFGFPLLIQAFCYACVIRCLLSKDVMQISQSCRRHTRDMTRVIRMLVAVVILFLICWLPIKILMTVITYSPTWLFIDDFSSNNFYIASYFVCNWMAMANSFVNPIIYSFMSKSFRIDLQELMIKIYGGSKRSSLVINKSRASRISQPNGVSVYNALAHDAQLNVIKQLSTSSNEKLATSVIMMIIEDRAEEHKACPMKSQLVQLRQLSSEQS